MNTVFKIINTIFKW